MTKVTNFEKWTEMELRLEIEQRRKSNKPFNKIVAELAEISGWKRKEIISIFNRVVTTGNLEKWTEEQLLAAIQEELKNTKSAHKIAAKLAEGSGWKRQEILKLLGNRVETEETLKGKLRPTNEDQSTIDVDPHTILQASKPWADFRTWQNSLLSVPDSNLYRVRKWGDPIMIQHGFDVNQSTQTNFQAVGLYNDGNHEFGAVSSFLRISHDDVMRLKALQIEDDYQDKREDWRKQKMNWLCKFRGTIYFFDNESDKWSTARCIRWGTLALGGNLVRVEGTELVRAKLRDGEKREVEMARLKGFRASDWDRPLDDLLAEGLVHRCFCAYRKNRFGDSPKGIVYSPFYSPLEWDFSGTAKPTALYIPVEWLEPKTPEYLT